MHRGGTSALAGTLQALGVDFGRHLLPPQPDNPLGFFEHRTVVRQHEALLHAAGTAWDEPLPELDEKKWQALARRPLAAIGRRLRADFAEAPLWGLKDPRLARLLPLWRPLLARLGARPHFLFILRHPAEVAASLQARDRVDRRKAGLLWLEHLLAAEAATRDASRFFLTYDELLADWRGVAARISRVFDFDWPRSPADPAVARGVNDFLQPALRHHHAARGGDTVGLRAAEEVYGWLHRLAVATAPPTGPESDEILAKLDRRRELLADLTWRHGEGERQLRADRARAQEIMDAQAAELKALRATERRLREDRANAQKVLDAQAGELAALRAEMETSRAAAARTREVVEALQRDRTEAQCVLEAQAAELAAQAQELALAETTRHDRAEAQRALDAQTARLEKLRRVFRAKRLRAAEIMKARRAEIADLRAVLAALQADRTEAQRVIDALHADLETLRRDYALLQSDRNDAQFIMEVLSADLARLRDGAAPPRALVQSETVS